jgi:hypothetical protein
MHADVSYDLPVRDRIALPRVPIFNDFHWISRRLESLSP